MAVVTIACVQSATRKHAAFALLKLGEGSFQAGTEGHRFEASGPERIPLGAGKRAVSL